MLLVRLGDTGGFNLDMLLAWEVATTPPPAAAEEEPSLAGGGLPVATPMEDAPPVMTVVLHFAGGAAVHDITLEGAEAEAMVSYLNSRSGALVRPV